MEEDIKWETKVPKTADPLVPVLNALLMLIEVEQKKTLEQIEHVKKMLELIKK